MPVHAFRIGMQLLDQPETASEYREALQETERARYFTETVLQDHRCCQDDCESQQHGEKKQIVQSRGGEGYTLVHGLTRNRRRKGGSLNLEPGHAKAVDRAVNLPQE